MQFSLGVSGPQPDGGWPGVILKASILPCLVLGLKRLRQVGLEQLGICKGISHFVYGFSVWSFHVAASDTRIHGGCRVLDL